MGALAFPPSLTAQLPPPPRDLALEVSRQVIVLVPGRADGEGVLLHAAYTLDLSGHED
jgi:hypothetical protein